MQERYNSAGDQSASMAAQVKQKSKLSINVTHRVARYKCPVSKKGGCGGKGECQGGFRALLTRLVADGEKTVLVAGGFGLDGPQPPVGGISQNLPSPLQGPGGVKFLERQ
ncbi:hypothetical protein CHARACLAT_031690 [Characodon lateralis]|uniref:Uncharacterized protein n=1 Tax=Characodon lateralis TaxID=208331 RepID=A0ABU7D2A6_9TELE|nr:hypothetical protein [Characodon lateralis]